MRPTKLLRAARFVTIAGSVVLLAACAGNPAAPDAGSAESAASVVDENGNRVVTPNPYLAEPANVPDGARQAISQARALFGQQQYAAAESTMQQVVAQWPELSGAWLNLAKIQLKLEQVAAAEQSLQQAVAANENNVFAWNSLGVLLRDQGRFEEAREAYTNALTRWPDFAQAHRNLGILFDLYLHQPERALHHYREAKALEEEEDRVLAGWIVDLERRL